MFFIKLFTSLLLVALALSGCGGGANTPSGTTNGSTGGMTGSVTGGTTPTKFVATEANVTSAEKIKIADRHNLYRAEISAVVLPELEWDDDLAIHAQTWANYLAENYTNDDRDNGRLPHAKVYQTDKHSEDNYVEGENIAASTKHIGYVADTPIDTSLEYAYNATGSAQELLDVNGSVDAWASEAFYYDYATNKTNTPGKIVGHYTQIIWKNTTKVGCGKAISKTYKFFNNIKDVYYEWVVCRYSLPGNVVGEKPY